MASTTVDTGTIFDRMLGFAHTPGLPKSREPKPKTDETHRFYLCEKKDGAKWTYTCQKGTLKEVCEERVERHQLAPKHPIYTGYHVMDVAAGCPEWNDEIVLAQKFMRLVKMGPPLAPPQASAPQ